MRSNWGGAWGGVIPAFGKLPLGVEVNEALKNKRCLRDDIGGPSSFVLAEETDTQVIFRQP